MYIGVASGAMAVIFAGMAVYAHCRHTTATAENQAVEELRARHAREQQNMVQEASTALQFIPPARPRNDTTHNYPVFSTPPGNNAVPRILQHLIDDGTFVNSRSSLEEGVPLSTPRGYLPLQLSSENSSPLGTRAVDIPASPVLQNSQESSWSERTPAQNQRRRLASGISYESI